MKVLMSILVWLLKMVDISVALQGDILTVGIVLAGKEVFSWEVDLIKDKNVSRPVARFDSRNVSQFQAKAGKSAGLKSGVDMRQG